MKHENKKLINISELIGFDIGLSLKPSLIRNDFDWTLEWLISIQSDIDYLLIEAEREEDYLSLDELQRISRNAPSVQIIPTVQIRRRLAEERILKYKKIGAVNLVAGDIKYLRKGEENFDSRTRMYSAVKLAIKNNFHLIWVGIDHLRGPALYLSNKYPRRLGFVHRNWLYTYYPPIAEADEYYMVDLESLKDDDVGITFRVLLELSARGFIAKVTNLDFNLHKCIVSMKEKINNQIIRLNL